MFPVDTTVSSTPASTRPGLDGLRRTGRGGGVMRRVRALLLVCWGLWVGGALPAQAAEPEIRQAALHRTAEGLFLSARLALTPSPAVEDALLKGVPLYFVWEAEVLRDRWYWTDKRVATAVRTWRLVYQPLTRRWRLSQSNDAAANSSGSGLQYALHQNFDSLAAALTSVGRVALWKLADASRLDADSDERVVWRFRLDLNLLPRPFQFGMANQPEWVIELQRRLDVPRQIEPVAPEADVDAMAR